MSTQLKYDLAFLRKHFAEMELAKDCREKAEAKIARAVGSKGKLIWSKLPSLLTVNPKVVKGEKYGHMTGILHFAPTFWSGENFCPFASAGCGLGCLTTSGHGQLHMMENGSHHVHIARVTRSLLYIRYRDQFMKKLEREIATLIRRAKRANALPAVRLNGTSDRLWEKEQPYLFSMFPNVTFYDYTKVPNRDVSHIPNYSLTFSLNENNRDAAFDQPLNVAVVFRLKKNEPLPKEWKGKEVIDGDVNDLRFLDKINVHVGLRTKGDTYNDTSGFAIDVAV